MTLDVNTVNISPRIEPGSELRWVEGRSLFASRQQRYEYFSSHHALGSSLAGRQRVRVPGVAPRDAEIPEEMPTYFVAQAARNERGQ